MMGMGFLNLAARTKARSWVLSPISARATTPIEVSRASIFKFPGRAKRRLTKSLPGRTGGCMVNGLAKSETACAMIVLIKYVDASAFDDPKAGYSPVTG